MLNEFRRRRQRDRVRPGDGSPLPPWRVWHLLSRSLFSLDLPGPDGARQVFTVDVRHSRDSSSSKRPAALYRDGVQVAASNLPAAFAVPGGVVEVATTAYGLKRIHLVTDDGAEEVLTPHPSSPEGLRARFARRWPRASALVGAVSVAVLLAGLAVTLALVAEKLTRVPEIAAAVGVFTSPVRLGGWAAVAAPAVGALAAVERGLALRSHWLLRAGA